MAKVAPKVTFEPMQDKIGGAWFVRMRYENGQADVRGFKSEQKALRWIASESAAWLKKYEGGRLA